MKNLNHDRNFSGRAMVKNISVGFTLLLLFVLGSCQKISGENTPFNEPASPAVVLAWNEIATQAFLHFPEQPAPPPMIESRIYAMVNVAMHDALNNIKAKYRTYALKAPDKNADPDAAVAQAAYDILIAETPWYKNKYDSL